jgi:hypothetical protein
MHHAVSTVNNESYDGSAWTEVNNVNTARLDTHAVGSATAALLFGGHLLIQMLLKVGMVQTGLQ